MNHLRLSDSLTKVKELFERKAIAALQVFASLYFPGARISRNPTYLDTRRKLRVMDDAKKLVEVFTVHILLSSQRSIDGLCLTLLSEVGHRLVGLGIANVNWQYALIHYLRWRRIILCSREGTRYLSNVLFFKSIDGAGLPLSQAVWMLEELVVYSLAGSTKFNCLILPQTLAVDCMYMQEIFFVPCRDNQAYVNEFWFLTKIWNILSTLLRGEFNSWIEKFPHENYMRNSLVERLLRLAFVIFINHTNDFDRDLSYLLMDFMGNSVSSVLSPKWLVLINTHLAPRIDSRVTCRQFVSMIQSIGEDFFLMKRYNTTANRKWATNLHVPTVVVVSENARVDFDAFARFSVSASNARTAVSQPKQETFADQHQTTQPLTQDNSAEAQDAEAQDVEAQDVEAQDAETQDAEAQDINKYTSAMQEKEIKPKILMIVSRTARAWLKRARNTLYNTSPLEKYKRKAESILSRTTPAGANYLNFYCDNICVLREDLVAGYAELNSKITELKSFNLSTIEVTNAIDEGLDVVEDQVVLRNIDINNKKHLELDMVWLQKQHEDGEKKVKSIYEQVAAVGSLISSAKEEQV